jgi:hypothetical protein
MLDTNFLALSIGPVAVLVGADRQSKGISEAQLSRKWEQHCATGAAKENGRQRTTVGVSVEWNPTVRVESRRSSS